MDFLQPLSHRQGVPVHYIPPRYQKYRIPAARPTYLLNSFGDFLTQAVHTHICRWQYNIFDIKKGTFLDPYAHRLLTTLHFTLKGFIPCRLRGFGDALLEEGIYHLFYVPPKIRHKAWFEPGTYFSFHIDLRRGIIRRLAVIYPEWQDVLARLKDHSARGVQYHAARITPLIRKMVRDIIFKCPAMEPDAGLFLEARILYFLQKYVENGPLARVAPAPETGKRIGQVTEYINSHPDYPLTIRSLAQEFLLSETALKKQFRLHTGETIGRFVVKSRMTKAIELIRTGLPIGRAAMEVGYFDFPSFDRAFTRWSGHHPGYYRR